MCLVSSTIRHYVGVNIWTSKRLQSMPSALRILSAQKKRLMDWWTWPGRSLSNCWRSGNYQVTFLIIWLIFKICACPWLSQKEFIVCQQFKHLHTTLSPRLFLTKLSSLTFWHGGRWCRYNSVSSKAGFRCLVGCRRHLVFPVLVVHVLEAVSPPFQPCISLLLGRT